MSSRGVSPSSSSAREHDVNERNERPSCAYRIFVHDRSIARGRVRLPEAYGSIVASGDEQNAVIVQRRGSHDSLVCLSTNQEEEEERTRVQLNVQSIASGNA